jgi:hypothetical protein
MSIVDDLISLVKSKNPQCLFHFTDLRNLDSIKQHGLLSADQLAQRGINPRAPGGNDWSVDADQLKGMHQFVHLCFWDEHPMEWRARQDNHIGETRFLRIDPEILRTVGVKVTDDVSNKSGVEAMTLEDGVPTLDLEVIFERTDWKNAEVKERLNASRKYEILIPDGVPLSMIRNL